MKPCTFETRYKVNPPIRSEEHRAACVAGLQDGTIDAVVTDHAPHEWEEKDQELTCSQRLRRFGTSVGAMLTYMYHTVISTS